jgi:hypothetical protein
MVVGCSRQSRTVLVFVVTIGVGIVAGGVLAASEAIEKRLTRMQR